ncbi:hypothetical protein IQ276_001810 [Desmonostoc muscorum LEGE 12446]|uniref:Uncharacterized protein n=1 Tax=Desmonostoc muscorum LEGE 12446 TaxID=1828758 RepID=A0A8J7D4G5_DESMC|nr:hypothetical protein [Desmonostoc muscorum]MCF2145207.1 hypothetical protein [Desmonostoc muscorum LEGE 12446]
MKNIKNILKILVLLTLITYVQLPAAWADVLTPGESPIAYCFQIANINKYSNYFIIAHIQSQNPNLPTYNRILKQGKCLGLNGYREYSDVYAIQKSQVKSQEIITTDEDEALKDFNAKKPLLIPAGININSPRTMSAIYGVKQVTDILEIVTIKEKSLDLKYKEVVYTSQWGTSERKAYQIDNQRPLPFNFLLMIFIVVFITGIVLVYKKLNFFKINN